MNFYRTDLVLNATICLRFEIIRISRIYFQATRDFSSIRFFTVPIFAEISFTTTDSIRIKFKVAGRSRNRFERNSGRPKVKSAKSQNRNRLDENESTRSRSRFCCFWLSVGYESFGFEFDVSFAKILATDLGWSSTLAI